jgi:GNAT superfamily N-acetyltransferase
MHTAGEGRRATAERLARGDEFFGWASAADGKVQSFGWVTRENRRVGPTALADLAGRIFLYNFHTLSAFRRRGLYRQLLLQLRYVLGSEGAAELIIDVSRQNAPSLRVIERAGFTPIARTAFITLFRSAPLEVRRQMLTTGVPPLFRT